MSEYKQLSTGYEVGPSNKSSVSSTWMHSSNRPRTSTISGSSRDGPKFYQNLCGMNPNDLYGIDFDNINSKYQPFYDKYQNDAAMLNHVIIIYSPTHAVLTSKKYDLLSNLWRNRLAILICLTIAILSFVLGFVHSVFWSFAGIFCILLSIYNGVVWKRKIKESNLINDKECCSYFCYDIVDRSIKFVIYNKSTRKPVNLNQHQTFCRLGDFLSINYIEASHGYESMVEIRCRRNFGNILSPTLTSNNNNNGNNNNGGVSSIININPSDARDSGIVSASSTTNSIAIVSVKVNHTLGINKVEFENIMQERIEIIRNMGVKTLDQTFQELSNR